MQLSSMYPVIATNRIAETAAFYIEHFGFSATFESDWYVSLRHDTAQHYELAVLDYTHASVPVAGQRPTTGLLLNFEVENVDELYARLITGAGLPVLLDLRSEEWGQRHFITADPNGVLIDVITNIPASESYAAQYTGQ
ncbi:VOC family protein [Herpetosiphon llansteffanensis]|uniref:VOC family protein n=1 Tax=Herpetosiphon llansteffanensis TaxID=2094568 RepID=UPI000D7CDA7A|nr:VOC family protein [Herpetosiphon llansteffanensis]